ncbi:hypothetical protein HIN55_23530 [Salmonella enterica subsp. enterica serovar Typhimurium]|nr:hypothetical protein [Salmonella enterica subsp. enterica serovar Typhimurium]
MGVFCLCQERMRFPEKGKTYSINEGNYIKFPNGAVIRQLPGQENVTLPVSTTGGKGRRWWFLNGEPVNGENNRLSLLLNIAGRYQLVVMDESGQVAAVNFELIR